LEKEAYFFWNASPPLGLKPKTFTDLRMAALNNCSYLAPLSLQRNWETNGSSFSILLITQKKNKLRTNYIVVINYIMHKHPMNLKENHTVL